MNSDSLELKSHGGIPFVNPVLSFAGIKLQNGKLSDYNIGNEARLHLREKVIKTIRILATFDGRTREVEVPTDSTIRDLKRQIRNVFPEEQSFGRALPEIRKDEKTLSNDLVIKNCIAQEECVEVIKSSMEVKAPLQDKEIDDAHKEDILSNFASVQNLFVFFLTS